MKKEMTFWQLIGTAAVSLMGTILHFLYEWTGQSVAVAPFSGVNESTWEHMKLLYYPLVIFALIQYFFMKDRDNYWHIKLIGILAGLAAIPVLFYTYNGILGKSPDWVNITIFILAALIAFGAEKILFSQDASRKRKNWPAIAGILLIGFLFILFTFVTPKIPLFQDPVTGIYGIA